MTSPTPNAAGRAGQGAHRPASAGAPGERGGRVFGPGPRRALAAAAAVLAVAGVAALAAHSGGGRAPAAPRGAGSSAKYGGLPSWLPKARTPVGRVLDASASRPAFSVQGEAVRASLPAGGEVLVTAAGPEVPEEGRFPVPPVTPTTFVVTFSSASRRIALAPSMFALVDERGDAHVPHVTGLHGGAPPLEVVPGGPVSLKLHAILPTGGGAVTWAPDGGRALASWDFSVEID
jgi:hypothetical protein